MIGFGGRIAPLSPHFSLLRPLNTPPSRLYCNLSYITSPSEKIQTIQLKNECDEFLPWLERKAGTEISSVLSPGNSIFGRTLYASKPIKAGDCVLKVPYSMQISPENLPLEIAPLIVNDIEMESRVALVLMAEQKLGSRSEWATYISCLPRLSEMHHLIFWREEELQMIKRSPLYRKTIEKKQQLEKEFSILKPVVDQFPHIFGDVQVENFMHARSLVTSRAWESTKGVSMIPFADFINHDSASKAMLEIDIDKEIAEVTADRNYAVGEEVMISYGKLSNATLLSDFGFTIANNPYDEVRILMDVPSNDPLYEAKFQLWHENYLPKKANKNNSREKERSFVIKEVKTSRRKMKGIPQSLLAFARVLSATSAQDLAEMELEAKENDGRLGRRPLKNREREFNAHSILLHHIEQIIPHHHSSIKELDLNGELSLRKRMARDLLKGELRVLHSAHAWLAGYCDFLKSK